MNEQSAAEVIWNRLPTRRELSDQLDRLALPADAKVLMGQLLATTAEVAGKVVEVGRRILAFVIELVRRFPNTAFGALVGVVLTFLVGSIPLLGLVLGPLLGPILIAFSLGTGALADIKNSSIDRQIEQFSIKLDAALAQR